MNLLVLMVSGPRAIGVRAALRKLGINLSWTRAVLVGLALGVALSLGVTGLAIGAEAAWILSLITLLLALAWLDIAWRWLPLEWLGALAFSGVVASLIEGRGTDALLGAAAPMCVLLVIRETFRRARGVEAMGFADVLLIGAVGLFTGLPDVFKILGIAAITGVCAQIAINQLAGNTIQRRFGVAFGTHISIVFAMWLLI